MQIDRPKRRDAESPQLAMPALLLLEPAHDRSQKLGGTVPRRERRAGQHPIARACAHGADEFGPAGFEGSYEKVGGLGHGLSRYPFPSALLPFGWLFLHALETGSVNLVN